MDLNAIRPVRMELLFLACLLRPIPIVRVQMQIMMSLPIALSVYQDMLVSIATLKFAQMAELLSPPPLPNPLPIAAAPLVLTLLPIALNVYPDILVQPAKLLRVKMEERSPALLLLSLLPIVPVRLDMTLFTIVLNVYPVIPARIVAYIVLLERRIV